MYPRTTIRRQLARSGVGEWESAGTGLETRPYRSGRVGVGKF
ncbi:hypothetical protein [Chroococcidiopsis sp. CCALA 051]|nr:hypothetical protein [Chroococcidiopsis sp. CCALA 051]